MAGMNQRESKIVQHDEIIKYTGAGVFDEHSANFTSTELETIDRLRYVASLVAHFERSRSEVAPSDAERIYEQCMTDIREGTDLGDDGENGFTLEAVVALVHLSTLCISELPNQPALQFHEWTETIFKWLGRERELFHKTHFVETVCSCIAVVEAGFRPVPESMSIYPRLAKLVDRTKEAGARGFLLRLASIVASGQPERESLALLITDAIHSPSEELIIHGIRAAAIFLDRFGDDSGFDSGVLEEDIPSAGQRECGVSKANIDRECRDVWEFVRNDDGQPPRLPLVDDIDFVVEGFAAQEILRCCHHVFTASIVGNFKRTRNGVFRISQRALGYDKPHRDRAHGISKSQQQHDRDKAHTLKDKERSEARKHREEELEGSDF